MTKEEKEFDFIKDPCSFLAEFDCAALYKQEAEFSRWINWIVESHIQLQGHVGTNEDREAIASNSFGTMASLTTHLDIYMANMHISCDSGLIIPYLIETMQEYCCKMIDKHKIYRYDPHHITCLKHWAIKCNEFMKIINDK